MKREHIGNEFDGFKGAVFCKLQRSGCIKGLVVEPMTRPDPPWTEKDWEKYAEILGVQDREQIAQHTEQWGTRRRQQYFAELDPYAGRDFFLDPDAGVATGKAKPEHVKPQEILGLLKEENVVAVYQHQSWGQSANQRVQAVADALHQLQPSTDCLGLAHEDQKSAMLFLSMQPNRLDDIAVCLEGYGLLRRFPPDRRLLTRVCLWNYKSIATCDVTLPQIAFLVGPNGSGKSNFLDALRFIADALSSNLDHALRIRGGLDLVQRTPRKGSEPFGMRLHVELPTYRGWYALTIGAKGDFGYEIRREECRLIHRGNGRKHFFRVERGKVVDASISDAPMAEADRLYLVTVSGLKAFRSAFDALAGMRSSNPIPDRIRPIQPPASARSLHRDGSNLASVLGSLEKRSPSFKTRIDQYLGSIVPGIAKTGRWPKDADETIEFWQDVGDGQKPFRLPASSMSDGTLRTLGILLALFQGAAAGETERQLVGIEEPEAALHPAAAEVLMDAIREAALHVQVLVTSHGAELLEGVPVESIIAVTADHGIALLGPVDEVARSALRDRLFTAGEFLRMDQLGPTKPDCQQATWLNLFDIES